jgi:toxin-antitoxin system PIN domain toxin
VSFALDVNILLYASDSGSPYHKRAGSFLEQCIRKEGLFYLAWPTVMSYLRIGTHSAVFLHPLTPKEAMTNIESLINLPHTRFLAEEEGFWKIYSGLTDQTPVRGNLVPDAHLAAILCQHGVKTLYTHDRDFLKFSFLEVLDPLQGDA